MKNIKLFVLSIFGLIGFALLAQAADIPSAPTKNNAISTSLSKNLPLPQWKGQRWEYSIKVPMDNQGAGVDLSRIEEVCNEAGENGWELISVDNIQHYSILYFKRPLLESQWAAQHTKLQAVEKKRLAEQAALNLALEKMKKAQASLLTKIQTQTITIPSPPK